MKISVFIATSLDGYIAKADGDIAWLMESRYALEGEDFGYQALYEACDVLVMGRNSFEKVASFDVWPYPDKRVIVMSRSLDAVSESYAELFDGTIETLMVKLQAEGCERLYIDGGQVIRSFLEGGLVTDMTITTIPILLGGGISLFGTLSKEKHLKLLSVQGYVNSFVQSRYQLLN